MDGDVAPLAELLELARRYGARLMVDEAHATGALGPGGRGAVSAAGLSGEVDVVMGTMGKALGSYGAYVCANAETVDYLVNRARPFIFSTAPPPPVVGAARAALGVLEAEPERVDRLMANARVLREALAAEGFAWATRPPRSCRSRSARRSRRWRSASGRWSAASSPRGSARRPCPRAPRGCASR